MSIIDDKPEFNKDHLKLIGSINTFDTVISGVGKTYKLLKLEEEVYLCIDKSMNVATFGFSDNETVDEYNLFQKTTLKRLYKISTITELLFKTVRIPKTIDWYNLGGIIQEKPLLKWCNKYTLPSSGKNPIRLFDNSDVKESGIFLRGLQEEIFSLYIMYSLWLYIMGGDTEIQGVNIINAPEEVEAIFWFAQKSRQDINYVLDDCLEAISNVYNWVIEPSSTHKMFITREGRITLETEANGIMDLFAVNLAVLMTNNLITDDEGNIENSKMKKCNRCGKLFWPEEGHTSYCYSDTCNRRNAWYHNHPEQKEISALKKKVKPLMEQGKSLNEISEIIKVNIDVLSKLKWKKSKL